MQDRQRLRYRPTHRPTEHVDRSEFERGDDGGCVRGHRRDGRFGRATRAADSRRVKGDDPMATGALIDKLGFPMIECAAESEQQHDG